MSLICVDSLDKNIWREFVDRHPLGNIFHTPDMFQVFEHAHGHHPMLNAIINTDGQVLALMTPVQVILKGGILHCLTTRSIVYGGVLCSTDSAGNEALALLLKTYAEKTKYDVLFTELRNLSDMSSFQPVLERYKFHYEDYLDYLIDLDLPSDQILQNIGSRTRQHIRRAIRKGSVIVEQVTDHNQIFTWYELIRKTYATARVPLAPISLFEAAFEILHPRNMVSFWLARAGSVYVAASAELHYKDMVYGWYSGVDRDFSNESPGELLMWKVLEWSAQNGYRIYDFGGAGKPKEEYGVRDFKAKFGGKLVCFGRNTWTPIPTLLGISRIGYFLFRHVFTW